VAFSVEGAPLLQLQLGSTSQLPDPQPEQRSHKATHQGGHDDLERFLRRLLRMIDAQVYKVSYGLCDVCARFPSAR
jgi:hypothetical protein